MDKKFDKSKLAEFFGSGTRIFAQGEDTRSLRLASELADLRSGYANPDIQSLPLGVSFAMIVRLGSRGEQHLLARQDTADGGMHSLLTSPLAKADSFSNMSGFVSELQLQNKKPTTRSVFVLAAELGFEPRHTESESAVLPLHNSASALTLVYFSTKKSFCQYFFVIFLRIK